MKKETVKNSAVVDVPMGTPPTTEKLADGQLSDHFVLPYHERQKEIVRPVRQQYRHEICGTITTMPLKCAETYTVDPTFYGATFCCGCGDYFPVGENGKFIWLDDKTKVGT